MTGRMEPWASTPLPSGAFATGGTPMCGQASTANNASVPAPATPQKPSAPLSFVADLPSGFRDALRCLRVTFDGAELQSGAFADRALPWARHMRAPRTHSAAWKRVAMFMERTIRYAPALCGDREPAADVAATDPAPRPPPHIDCAAAVSDLHVTCIVPAASVRTAVSRIRAALRGVGLSAFEVTVVAALDDLVLENVMRASLQADLIESERWSAALDGALLLGAFTRNAIPGRWVNLPASTEGLRVSLAPDGGDAVALGLGNPCMARLRHLPVVGLGRDGPTGTQCFPLPMGSMRALALELVTPSPEAADSSPGEARFTDAMSGRTSWTIEELRAFWRDTRNIFLPRNGFDVVRIAYDQKESGNSYTFPAPCVLGAPVGASGIPGQISMARSQLALEFKADAARLHFAGFPHLLKSITDADEHEVVEHVPATMGEGANALVPMSDVDGGPHNDVWPYLNSKGEVAPSVPRPHHISLALREESILEGSVSLPPSAPDTPCDPQVCRPWTRRTEAGSLDVGTSVQPRHPHKGTWYDDSVLVEATPEWKKDDISLPGTESLERYRYTPPLRSTDTTSSVHPNCETEAKRKGSKGKRTLRTGAMAPGAAFAAMDACMKSTASPSSEPGHTASSSKYGGRPSNPSKAREQPEAGSAQSGGSVDSPPHKVPQPRNRFRHTDIIRGMQLGEAEEQVLSAYARGGSKALSKLPAYTLSDFLEVRQATPPAGRDPLSREALVSLVEGLIHGKGSGR